jgi:hypothetical protein
MRRGRLAVQTQELSPIQDDEVRAGRLLDDLGHFPVVFALQDFDSGQILLG